MEFGYWAGLEMPPLALALREIPFVESWGWRFRISFIR
jgi:hypothetical protein